jgi:glycosyltransferase involved in cell wall biosynthesis
MKIAIIDKLGLCYDGDTLKKQGLGGSESAVIRISNELSEIGFEVTVYNNCKDGKNSAPGIYDSVRYIDNSDAKEDTTIYDIVVVSRTIMPFVSKDWPFLHTAKKRILWLHDTFIEGDQITEDLVVSGKIDHIFTLSDWHTTYVLNSSHGPKRNFEVLKKKVFQTRNGADCYIDEVDLSKKDPYHFVYNSSATKGMIPLVEDIWPQIKKAIPKARLTVIGGYYRFREGAKPDEQENTVSGLAARQDLKDLGITFTGVISQKEIANILANAWMMLYPGAFPETFGISTLESLIYKTPLLTTRFGALEETAVEKACYLIDYAIEPNSLFPHINKKTQIEKYLKKFFEVYPITYLHQQKQNYCDVVRDIAGWDTVALQWKQFLYKICNKFLSVEEYRTVTRINEKVERVFGRTSNMPMNEKYSSYGKQQRILIVSPFWNAEKYICENILSVAQQDYDNYLHILINDASTDRSEEVISETIKSLPSDIQDRFKVITNQENQGCIYNQINAINEYANSDDIVMLLDGDDYIVNNPTIFHYYNDLYSQGYEFTYGSMWSMVDNIPLIAQEYPQEVKQSKTYREHRFNWKIPYTHLRTCLSQYFKTINQEVFKVDNQWMKSGADNPLFYELIEQIHPDKIYCNREIVCYYNDASPYNDYKIKGEEQNRNANMSYKKQDKFSVIVPTMWRSKTLFKESLQRLLNNVLVDEIIIINNDVEKTPEWPWILSHEKVKLLNQKENIKVNPAWNLGVRESKNDLVAIINDDLCFDTKLFYKIANHIHDDIGAYGFIVGGEQYSQPEIVDGSINFIHWNPSVCAYGFGQLMVMNKKNWTPIIDELEVYFGDDFIMENIHQSGKDIYLIANMEYKEDFGCTTKELGIWQEYYDREKIIFENWINLKEEVKKVKTILIAIPTNKYIEPETFKSIYDQEVPEGYKTEFQFFYGYQIDQIRNLIAEWAKNYDYLFSVDSDIILPKDALRKMIAADKDIVSGMYIQRIPNSHILEIYMVNKNGGIVNIPDEFIAPYNGLVEIAGCGFGCCLVKGEVFRAMEYPHFYYKSAIDHNDTVSEDIYFCKKARDLEFKIWVDTTIKCDHKGSTLYRVNLKEPKKEIQAESKTEKDAGVTVIPDTYRNEKVFR